MVAVYAVSLLGEYLFCFLIFQHTNFSMKKYQECIRDICTSVIPLHIAVIPMFANLRDILFNCIPL